VPFGSVVAGAIAGPGSRWAEIGRGVGEIVGGGFAFAAGMAGMLGGGAASGTGVLTLPGVAAVVGSAALVAGGIANVMTGAERLGQALSMSSGGGSSGPQGTTPAGQGGTKIADDELKAPPAKRGNAPVAKDDHPVELHHRNQTPDSPLDEMTRTDHRGPGNFSKNHPNTGSQPSQINREAWRQERKRYWQKEWDRGRFKDK
jgi:hypothetical protein